VESQYEDDNYEKINVEIVKESELERED